jgi:serine phosphatase RsbU (regulator of sigma subunit)
MPVAVRSLRSICMIALLAICANPFCAHTQAANPAAPLVIDGLGKGTIPLDGPWQFHAGDDLSWANPAFDDSHWEHTDISRPWGDQGHWNYAGHAWYRRSIDFKSTPGDTSNLALFVPGALCSYQVYWNGRLIGSTGRMPAPASLNQSTAQIFPLGNPGRGVLAFRVATTPLDSTTAGNGLGSIAMPRVGDFESISNLAAKQHASAIRRIFLEIVQIVIYGQLFLLGALVWLRNRNQKLLFWMSAFLLADALWVSLDPVLFPWLLTSPVACAFYGPTFHSIEDIALWYLLLYLLDLDRYPALMRLTRILACTTFFSAVFDDFVFLMPGRDMHPLAFESMDALATVGFSLPEIFPLILIALAFKQRMNPARRFVAIAAFLSNMYFVVAHTSEQGERFTQWTLYNFMTRPLFTVDGIDVSVPAILSLLLVCAIVYAVYRYSVEQGQRQTALEQEHHNARAVQQVLIPDAIPSFHGFSIESVYKPAGEVGGDFFQIIPVASPEVTRMPSPKGALIASPKGALIASPDVVRIAFPEGAPIASPETTRIASPKGAPIASPDVTRIAFPEGAGAFRPLNASTKQEGFSPGQFDPQTGRVSALIVIGDVSGKGMPAAMTVSLLVGTVRTLAHYTQSPAAILSAMNQRMLGRSQGGFTTCLVLRVDSNGTLTVANAGHIAPYLAGKELPLENGLPLGLAAESTYPESTFHLAPAAQLTLLTDGVVEARDKDGALFGFERTADISQDSAEKVAQAAQAFGQDDDITVLTLTRLPIGKLSTAHHAAPILSPAGAPS